MSYPLPPQSSPLKRQRDSDEVKVCVGVVERSMKMRGQVLSRECSRLWLSREPRTGGGENVGGTALVLFSNTHPS